MQPLPALEVLLGHRVLDRGDRVPLDQAAEVPQVLLDRALAALTGVVVAAVAEELGRSQAEGDRVGTESPLVPPRQGATSGEVSGLRGSRQTDACCRRCHATPSRQTARANDLDRFR